MEQQPTYDEQKAMEHLIGVMRQQVSKSLNFVMLAADVTEAANDIKALRERIDALENERAVDGTQFDSPQSLFDERVSAVVSNVVDKDFIANALDCSEVLTNENFANYVDSNHVNELVDISECVTDDSLERRVKNVITEWDEDGGLWDTISRPSAENTSDVKAALERLRDAVIDAIDAISE
jgi:hypothetical protein